MKEIEREKERQREEYLEREEKEKDNMRESKRGEVYGIDGCVFKHAYYYRILFWNIFLGIFFLSEKDSYIQII